jgi:hypothetical protein
MAESPYVVLDYHNVLLDHTLIQAPRPHTAAEEDEYFRLTRGAVRLACTPNAGEPPELDAAMLGNSIKNVGHNWFSSTLDFLAATQLTQGEDAFPYLDCDTVIEEPTMLVKRFEYANLYHQSTDYINVEIARHLLDLDNASVAVELLDGHRRSDIDVVWERVFDNSDAPSCHKQAAHEHLHHLHARLRRKVVQRVCYKRLILVSPGYASRSFAMSSRNDPCAIPTPFYASMRERFLRSFGVQSNDAVADPNQCVIIARRDYQAHPRNPVGAISRKFADEDMVLSAAATAGLKCTMIDLARMTVEMQVRRIAQASILMGIHGAGLSFVFILPPNATLLEARVLPNLHFENLAGYSGRRYVGFESGGSHGQSRFNFDEEVLVKAFRKAASQ